MRSAVLILFALSPLVYSEGYTSRVVAGSDWIGDNGPARDALLLQAEGIAAGTDGSVYVSDAQTHRVRQITASGTIRTIAGTGTAGYTGDGGFASDAQLSAPYGLALDASGNLFIADLGNRRIRRVGRDGVISTVARDLGFRAPRNLAVDSTGNLYVSDFDGGAVYRIAPSGAASIVAMLKHPAGLALDRSGSLYVGETGTRQVRKIENGVVRTVASVAAPTGLAIDALGTLYVADAAGGGIFRFPVTGTAPPLAIAARDVTSTGSVLYSTDGRQVRRIVPTGQVVIAGFGSTAHGDLGPATQARLNNPSGLAMDAQGNLYIADSDNHRVRRVDRNGVITTIAGTGAPVNDGDGGRAVLGSIHSPSALSFDPDGNLYIAAEDRIRKVDTRGFLSTAPSMPLPACLAQPPVGPFACVIATHDGLLYAADAETDRVWEFSPKEVPPDPVTLVSLVNAASRTGPLAPGMLTLIEGVSLTAPEVRINGQPALTISNTAVVVPPGVQPGVAEAEIVGVGTVLVTIAAASPAIFVAVNEDGSVNDPAHAAARGSILTLYGTGQGVEPLPVTVRFGAFDTELLYSGPVAGYPGLWQVNARVPGGFLPPGSMPLTVRVGEAESPALTVHVN